MERICYRGINECAEAMGIAKRTLIRLMKNDPTFPVIRTGPRNCLSLFPVKQIEEWMATRAGNRVVVDPAFDSEGLPDVGMTELDLDNDQMKPAEVEA